MPAKLSSLAISGFTPDGGNDKDDNSQIKFTIFTDFGGGFIQKVGQTEFQAYGRFPDGQPWGPINIPVSGTFTIENASRVKGYMEFQPDGDDTWIFTYSLDMTFDDGTVLSKEGAASVSDSKRRTDL